MTIAEARSLLWNEASAYPQLVEAAAVICEQADPGERDLARCDAIGGLPGEFALMHRQNRLDGDADSAGDNSHKETARPFAAPMVLSFSPSMGASPVWKTQLRAEHLDRGDVVSLWRMFESRCVESGHCSLLVDATMVRSLNMAAVRELQQLSFSIKEASGQFAIIVMPSVASSMPGLDHLRSMEVRTTSADLPTSFYRSRH